MTAPGPVRLTDRAAIAIDGRGDYYLRGINGHFGDQIGTLADVQTLGLALVAFADGHVAPGPDGRRPVEGWRERRTGGRRSWILDMGWLHASVFLSSVDGRVEWLLSTADRTRPIEQAASVDGAMLAAEDAARALHSEMGRALGIDQAARIKALEAALVEACDSHEVFYTALAGTDPSVLNKTMLDIDDVPGAVDRWRTLATGDAP